MNTIGKVLQQILTSIGQLLTGNQALAANVATLSTKLDQTNAKLDQILADINVPEPVTGIVVEPGTPKTNFGTPKIN